MDSSTRLLLLLLGCILLITTGFGVWSYRLDNASIQKITPCKLRSPDQKWDTSCLFFQEISPDTKLADPSDLQLSLLQFSYVNSAGPPLTVPMWYRFRYVNTKTGGYSKFSKWTSSPVQAGSNNLPCLQSTCDGNNVKGGKKSCSFNKPTMGILSNLLHYNITQNPSIYINVHRWIPPNNDVSNHNPPPDDQDISKSEIVGFLLPPRFINGKTYNVVYDIVYNPCVNSSCDSAPGCN
jgi:hypothetical protein